MSLYAAAVLAACVCAVTIILSIDRWLQGRRRAEIERRRRARRGYLHEVE